MDPGMLHGLTFLLGHPHSWMKRAGLGAAQHKLTVSVTNERFNDTSPRSIPALTYHLFGFVIAFTTILIGTIVSQTASFLTSTETSLLSWKSNLGIPFVPGSKFGLYTSLWLREFLDRIGNTLHVKLLPTTIQQLSFQNPYTASPVFRHCIQINSASTSSGSVN